MRVLIVCSGNGNKIAPFVTLQRDKLQEIGVECLIFLINRKGIIGYLSLLINYWQVIKRFKPNIIHAHYGVSGMFALIQLKTPVIISYIGSDVLNNRIKIISYFSMVFTKYSIFVSQSLYDSIPFKLKNFKVIPYGIDIEKFQPMDKEIAREKLGLSLKSKYCLFPSSKNRPEKNFPLAEKAINEVGGIEIIEIGGTLNIEELNIIFNACDFLLLTSKHEGGPQVIFEAMAVNLPIISVDVGVVKKTIYGLEGCYLSTYDLDDIKYKIKLALEFNNRTEGRKRIISLNLDSKKLANEIYDLYQSIL